MLTHHNMVSLQAQTLSLLAIFQEGKETVMAFLPFFHIYGQVVVMLGGLARAPPWSCSPPRISRKSSRPWSATRLPVFTVCPPFLNT